MFFQFRSVSVSISIIWHAGLFFRSYSGNLPAMFFCCVLRARFCKFAVLCMYDILKNVFHDFDSSISH